MTRLRFLWMGLTLASALMMLACSKDRSASLQTSNAADVSSTAEPAATVPSSSQRLVVRRAALMLVSERVAATADRAAAIAVELGGYVAERKHEYQSDQVVQATLVLRLPASAFDDGLQRVKASAAVVSESLNSSDVTDEYSDVQARLKTQQTLEARLLSMLDVAHKVPDLLELERELARVRAEIERLTGRQQLLKNQTEYGALELLIASPEQPAVGDVQSTSSRFKNALADSLELSIAVVLGLIQLSGAFLPLLALALVAYAGFRWQRRRKLKVAST